jgi:Domain of unknown function (DUF4124)
MPGSSFEEPAVKKAIRLLVAAACFGSVGALAQTVFKSTMPDGRIVYGEKPAPGAVRVETLEPLPPKSGIQGLTAEEKARAGQIDRRRTGASAGASPGEHEFDEARRQLQQAEAAREAGKEPLPGERIGIAGGGSRLTEAYHARQKGLDDAVDAARKRVSAAQRALR